MTSTSCLRNEASWRECQDPSRGRLGHMVADPSVRNKANPRPWKAGTGKATKLRNKANSGPGARGWGSGIAECGVKSRRILRHATSGKCGRAKQSQVARGWMKAKFRLYKELWKIVACCTSARTKPISTPGSVRTPGLWRRCAWHTLRTASQARETKPIGAGTWLSLPARARMWGPFRGLGVDSRVIARGSSADNKIVHPMAVMYQKMSRKMYERLSPRHLYR